MATVCAKSTQHWRYWRQAGNEATGAADHAVSNRITPWNGFFGKGNTAFLRHTKEASRIRLGLKIIQADKERNHLARYWATTPISESSSTGLTT